MKRPKYLRQIAEKITKTETKTIFISPDFYRIAELATLNAYLKQMTDSGYINRIMRANFRHLRRKRYAASPQGLIFVEFPRIQRREDRLNIKFDFGEKLAATGEIASKSAVFTTDNILDTLRNMNVVNIKYSFYATTFKASKVCTTLNALFGLGLDKKYDQPKDLNKKLKKYRGSSHIHHLLK